MGKKIVLELLENDKIAIFPNFIFNLFCLFVFEMEI